MILDNITSSNHTSPTTVVYDYDGAFVFIIFILFWYSLFVVGLLYVQNKTNEIDYYEDSDDPQEVTARSLLKSLRSEESIRREDLGILSDKVLKIQE